MTDLLFGTHIAGWQAFVQFWFWTGICLAVLFYMWKRGK